MSALDSGKVQSAGVIAYQQATGKTHFWLRVGAALDHGAGAASPPANRPESSEIIVLFNGDLEALRKRYRTNFEVNDSSWVLVLTPRGAPLDRFIASVTMRGDASGGMREMVMVEKGGDQTTTRFDDVDLDHVFDQREIAEVFSLDVRKSP